MSVSSAVARVCLAATAAAWCAHARANEAEAPPNGPAAPAPSASAPPVASQPDSPASRPAGSLPQHALARLGEVRFYHGQQIQSVAYSPDGAILATADRVSRAGGRICLWDARTGRSVRVIDAGQRGAWSIAFSPDGGLLYAAGLDNTLRCWEVATGEKVREQRIQVSGYVRLCMAPDGEFMLIGSNQNALVWDLRKNAAGVKLPQGHLLSLSGKAGRAIIASPYNRKAAAELYEVPSGKRLRSFGQNSQQLMDVAISADGKRVAVAEVTGVHVYDADSGQETANLTKDTAMTFALAFVGDNGDRLLTASRTSHLQLWSLGADTDKPLWKARDISVQQFGNVAVSPDGARVATGGNDQSVHVFELGTGRRITLDAGHVGAVNAVRFAPGRQADRVLTAGADGTLRLWDLPSGAESTRLAVPDANWAALAAASGRAVLYAGAADGRLFKWNPARPDADPDLLAKSAAPRAQLLPGPTDDSLLAADADGSVWRLDPDAAEPRRLAPPFKGAVTAVAVSPAGRLSAIAVNNNVRVVRAVAAEGDSYVIHAQPGKVVRAIAFGPDGQLVAWGNGPEVLVEEALSGRPVHTFATKGQPQWGHGGALAFSPDGRVLAGGGAGGDILLFDLLTGLALPQLTGHLGWVTDLAFSSDGRRLVSCASDSTAIVWSLDGIVPEAPAAEATLPSLWDALASENAAEAWCAGFTMPARGAAVDYLAKHLAPTRKPDPAQLAKLIADLSSDQFAERERAQTELAKIGAIAEPALRAAAAERAATVEAKLRVGTLLESMRDTTRLHRDTLRLLRAVHVLERIPTPEGRALLESLAGGAPGALLTEGAQAALRRLAIRAAATGPASP